MKHNGNTTLIFFFESVSETLEGAPTFSEPVSDSNHLPSPLGQVSVKQMKLPHSGTTMIQDNPGLSRPCVS